MRTLHGHPKKLTLVAYGIAVAVVLVIAFEWGIGRFVDSWGHLQPFWLLVALGGELLSTLAYMVAYRAVMHFDQGPWLPLTLALRVVSLGFGPFVPAGGFDVDQRALQNVHGDRHVVSTRIFAMGALEWGVLAPAACVAAIALLVHGDPRPMKSVLWPWALGVPAGFVIGFYVVFRICRGGIDENRSGLRGSLGRAVRGAWMLSELPREPRNGWPALFGMILYWSLDIASFYGAVRFVGLHTNLGEVVLAYATGYALTRRTMPFGGAGITEALMTFALHWVGQPIPASLAAVVVYRLFNFVLPAAPALLAHNEVAPLVTAAYRGGRGAPNLQTSGGGGKARR